MDEPYREQINHETIRDQIYDAQQEALKENIDQEKLDKMTEDEIHDALVEIQDLEEDEKELRSYRYQ